MRSHQNKNNFTHLKRKLFLGSFGIDYGRSENAGGKALLSVFYFPYIRSFNLQHVV